DVGRLRHHLAVRVEDGARVIPALADVRRMGGQTERDAHLLGDRRQQRVPYREAGSFLHQRRSSSIFPAPSTVACQPAGTKVVASACTTEAGPATRSPAPSWSRATTWMP